MSKAETNCYLTQVNVDAKNHFHTGEEPAEAWIPQRFADQRPLTPFLAFLPGIRALVAGLVLVALVPNLTLGAIFWLGVIDTPWSMPSAHPPNESSGPAAQSAGPSPVLSSPAMLEAAASGNLIFPITLDGTDGVPARSIIAIRGLPQGSKLSSGRPYDETEWNLKPDEIGDLHLVLPSNASGEAKLIIQLVAPDGAILADATTILKVTTDSAPKAELAQPQVRDVQSEGLGSTGGGDKVANVDAASTVMGPNALSTVVAASAFARLYPLHQLTQVLRTGTSLTCGCASSALGAESVVTFKMVVASAIMAPSGATSWIISLASLLQFTD